MPVRKSHLTMLRPYLVGEGPRDNGEWDMHCPLHEDGKRSAQINVQNGYWNCHAGCGGGRIVQLIRKRGEWVDPSAAATSNGRPRRRSGGPVRSAPTDAMVKGWVNSLTDDLTEYLTDERMLSTDVIAEYEIGWSVDERAYTIPVRDLDGTILNIRFYDPSPRDDRRKIWSYGEGYGAPRLFPMKVFESDPKSLIVLEGEWDSLCSISHGYPAVTRTGAAKVWDASWGQYFAGRIVYTCHDMDRAGQDANKIVARSLRRIAKDVRTIELPYEVKPKDGKDVTDFWGEYGRREFRRLLRAAGGAQKADRPETLDPSDASVLEALDSRQTGRPLKLIVTVKGKREPGYSIPSRVHYSCTRDAGTKCNACPMNAAGGEAEVEVSPRDPVVLELIDSTKGQVHDALREHFGAMKCNKLTIEPESHQAVEQLYARPSVDHASGGSGDYKTIKLTSVGKHDTQPNSTVEVVGALFPDPRRQLNEFQAWDVKPLQTSLDQFEIDAETIALLSRFRPARGQPPIRKLREIADDLATYVTHIYGLPQMHAAMDLVFHSPLSFDFGGKRIQRGWLELLIVGDTRTGKSEAAMKLSEHYRAGEVVSCESASFAGVVGGMQQFGSNKEWSISWGVIPLNDRRLVVLDEVSGLAREEIAQLSDVRSRGVAQLTKIGGHEATHARTRLIWLGNPRDARMEDYTYGVQAIPPLIGNPEDIARFDLAMSVRAGDVPSAVINSRHPGGKLRYTAEAGSALLRWVWSRTPEQIVWRDGAQDAVYRAAIKMGRRYVEDPPLVQTANVREKIARLSVALAARLFSTDEDAETVIVTKRHVNNAVAFMDHIYGMKGFGYAERSRIRIKHEDEAERSRGDIKLFLYSKKDLATFLRDTSSFRRQDLEEVLNVDREMSNAVINKLYQSRMVRKVKGDVRVEPALQEVLREMDL